KLGEVERFQTRSARVPVHDSTFPYLQPPVHSGRWDTPMAQGFYSLEEAARALGMTPEEVNQMAQKREIRAFADRGTWRFRMQDVEEKARQLGRGSSPELQLGDAPKAKPHDSPAPAPKQVEDSSVFTFQLGSDDEVELGSEVGRGSAG